jgi:hypothetical protein
MIIKVLNVIAINGTDSAITFYPGKGVLANDTGLA